MVKTLEKKGLILRQPGVPRSIQVLVPEDEIPPWRKGGGKSKRPQPGGKRTKPQPAATASPPTNLYVLAVYLMGGPVSEEFANKEISRVIEIRGDQTLQQLHEAIFQAYDRWDEHLYEFQFGRRPFDPDGPNYGLPTGKNRKHRDARTTKLDDLQLKPHRVFGYWFDFGDDWWHRIKVQKVVETDSKKRHIRLIKSVGESPPQYPDWDDDEYDDEDYE